LWHKFILQILKVRQGLRLRKKRMEAVSNDARLAKPLTHTCLSSRMENRKPSYRATWIVGGELIARIASVTISREA